MPSDPLPKDVRDFLIRYIDSVAQLEALLLLRRNCEEAWDVPKMAARLYISEPHCNGVLLGLLRNDLAIFESGTFVFSTASPNLVAIVDKLAETYSSHLIQITHMIHSKAAKIRQFSDAFKLNKDS